MRRRSRNGATRVQVLLKIDPRGASKTYPFRLRVLASDRADFRADLYKALCLLSDDNQI